jgi:hypothetical protein
MEAALEPIEEIKYGALPTIKRFHESGAQIRCIVGPVGSGKTSGAAQEVGNYLPHFMFDRYGIKKTRWVIVRNTYRELIDTTQKTVFEWFPNGFGRGYDSINYTISYENGIQSELWFRACDRIADLKKFKSLEVTGYWIDESIEVAEEIKRMLKTRIGRYPKRPIKCPVRFGIETTNPPDVEHATYSNFKWNTPPPGPKPEKNPLPKHEGFWQPPYENAKNLRPRYYEDLRTDYADSPDWIDMYIEAKPGIILRGKPVYNNFRREYHEAKEPLLWIGQNSNNKTLYRGWDNSGNIPACAVCQVPAPNQIHVLKEFYSDKMSIGDFTDYVMAQSNLLWPNAEYYDWEDPAGEAEYSKKEGGFTSNGRIMRERGVDVHPSEANPRACIDAVEQQLRIRDGLLVDPSCVRIINGFLGGFCYPEIGPVGSQIYSDKVQKNRFSHIHEALYYAVVKLTKNLPNWKAKPRRGWRDRSYGRATSWRTV